MNLYKLTNITWLSSDSDREDIKHVHLARKLGFDVFTSGRFQNGRQIPPDMLTFKYGGVNIWFSVKDEPHWVAANIKDGRYVDHRSYPNLKKALITESFI